MKTALPTRVVVHRAAAVCIALAAVVFTAAAMHDAHSWMGTPYPGFLLFPNGIISAIQPLDKANAEGLAFPSHITHVDGQAVRSSDDIYALAKTKGPGASLTYTIVQGGHIRTARIPVRLFTAADFLSISALTCLAGIVCVGLALVFLWLSQLDGPARYLTGVSMSFGFFAIFSLDFLFRHRFTFLYLPTIVLQPAFHALFGLSFPEERSLLRNKYFPLTLWSLAALVWLGHVASISHPGIYSIFNLIAVLGVIAGVSITVSSTVYSWRYSLSLEVRKRAKIVTGGFLLALLMFVPFLILSWFYGVSWASFMWTLATLFAGFFLTYAVLKHNIFEVDDALRKLMSYVLVLTIVTILYIGLLSGLNVAFSRVGAGQLPSAVVSAVFIVFVFIPLRDIIKRFVDRTFFRERYELEKAFERIIDAMSSIINLEKLLDVLLTSLSESLHLVRAGILLPASGGDFVLAAHLGQGSSATTLEIGNPVLAMIARTREPVVKAQFGTRPDARALTDALDTMGAQVVIPMLYREKLVGLMSLGEKQSGAEFVREDLRLLLVFARQASLAIENARLHEEEKQKDRMSLELASARQIQMSLLPQKDPEAAGLEISGVCLTAKEVGGDFYDYIPLADGSLGVAIGDVAGKGASAALVMTMVKAVIESQQETMKTPVEMLAPLHKISHRSKRMITFFYGILNAARNSLSFSNAGHNFPYLLRNGHVSFLHEDSDLPLGTGSGEPFREFHLPLLPGDTLVFYTDGIVEAHRGKDLYGFERFEESLRRHGHLSPKELQRGICADVQRFCGDQDPSDDMTMVVIRVAGTPGTPP